MDVNDKDTNSPIKLRVEALYTQIKDANAELEDIKSKCSHEITMEGYYGNYRRHTWSEICYHCGKWIKTLRNTK